MLFIAIEYQPSHSLFTAKLVSNFKAAKFDIFKTEKGPVAKGQTISEANYGVLNSSEKGTKLTVLSIFFAQDSDFPSFFDELRGP